MYYIGHFQISSLPWYGILSSLISQSKLLQNLLFTDTELFYKKLLFMDTELFITDKKTLLFMDTKLLDTEMSFLLTPFFSS